MSLTAAILLILSTFTHAGWNYISKKEQPTSAYFLVANSIGVIFVLPLLFYYRHEVSLIPEAVWIYTGMSGFFLAAYMAALAGAYRNGDMSIAYPLARSLPVIFVFVLTLFLDKQHLSKWWFIAGIILVVAGCLILPLKFFRDFHPRNYVNVCCLLAVAAAVGISAYTVTDDTALRHLRELPGKPLSPVDGTLIYMVLEGMSCSLWQVFFVLFSSKERSNFRETIANFKLAATLTGIGIYLTYGLVLASMNYVTNVSYVAAFRQLSIPLGATCGMVFLNESRHLPKVMGVTIIFFGLILVGTG